MVHIRDYIEIKKELVPYTFNILLGDEWFFFDVSYNKTADMFTLTIRKNDEVITTEPLVLGVPLFKDTYRAGFPSVTLVPYDPNGNETKVTYDNLNDSVFLSIDDEGGDDGD